MEQEKYPSGKDCLTFSGDQISGPPNTRKITPDLFEDQISGPLTITKILPEIRVGSLCPKCGVGHLDYDGCLNLYCKNCGFTSGGCFT